MKPPISRVAPPLHKYICVYLYIGMYVCMYIMENWLHTFSLLHKFFGVCLYIYKEKRLARLKKKKKLKKKRVIQTERSKGSMNSMRNESINITLKFLWRHFYGEYILISCVLFKLWSSLTRTRTKWCELVRSLGDWH